MGDTIHKRGGLSVEYAKSGRSSCKACSGAIAQDTVRIGNETKSEYHDGWDMSWYHLKCCNNKWGAPRINSFGEIRDGEMLRWDDQIAIKKMVGEKIDNNEEEKRREKENKDLWSLKDTLEDKVPTKILKSLLEANGFDPGKTAPPARVIHKAADGLLWGIIGPCPECKNANSLRYNGTEYICRTGWISEFTRCEFKGTKGVERYKFVIPADLKKANSYLKDYKYPPGHPTKEKGKDGGDSKEEEKEEEPEEEEEKDDGTPEEEPPVGQELWGMKIAVAGTKKDLGMTQDDVGDIITKHGGEFQDDIYVDTTILVASDEEVKKKKKTKKVQTALKQKLPVLTVEWLTNLTERKEEGIKLRQLSVAKKYIAGDVDYDESKKLGKKYSKDALAKEKAKEEKEAKKEEERKKKEEEEKIKDQELKKKRKRSEPKAGSDILKIDPKALKEVSGNPEILVTYDDDYGHTAYSVMLNVSDIATGTNKFYRMQVIRNKGKKSYWFFISWGRVGTDIGDSKIYKKTTENSAIEAFAQKFFDQTGVQWEDRHKFQKKPGKYFMVELDDGHEDEEAEEEIKKVKRQKQEKSESIPMQVDAKGEHIPSRVQDLINLIFDKEMMKKTLQAMEVDIKKMPLGKISRNQIKEGYRALTELQEILQQTNPPKSKLQDCTNRFYTIIPHDFGRSNPPLIGDIESVKKKIQLMDTLLDIEIANAVMKDADKLDESDPIYKNYKSLKSQIAPLEKGSDLYKLLESYAYNTHDKNYFSTFDFDVVDIFEIQRDGEKDRYQPWKDSNNRMLLWHGSRLTNWVGILSQGLRIAPPEAPKTGYRFGKGVYFADCISKSGSYCFTSNDAPQAVMLLAEVALGNMNELLRDEYMEKAPSGKHCTKALGMAAPNAKDSQKIPNDVTVPAGKITSTGIKSACSHNEYIIYDTAQINIRYLVRLKFKHKTSFW